MSNSLRERKKHKLNKCVLELFKVGARIFYVYSSFIWQNGGWRVCFYGSFLPQLVGVEDAQARVVDDVLMSGGIVVVRLEHEVGGAAVLLAQRDAHMVRQGLALGSHSLRISWE